MQKKKLIIAAAFILGVIVFIGVLKNVGLSRIVDIFANADKFWIWVFLAVSIVIILMLIIRWQVILKSKRVDLPFWKVALFKLVGFSFSYLTPTGQIGGESIRGVLLTKEKVPNATAFSSVMIDKFIELATTMTFACVGFIFITLNYRLTENTLLTVVGALVVAVALLVLFYYRITNNKGFISSAYYLLRLNRILRLRKYELQIREIEIDISNFFRFDKKTLKIALLLSLLSWIFMFMEYESALLTFGYSPSILALFLVICVIGFVYIFPIPATLGVLEISQASLFTILNVDVGIGIALGLLIRLRDVLWALIGLVYLSGYRYFSKKKFDGVMVYRVAYIKRKGSMMAARCYDSIRLNIRKICRECRYKYILIRKRFWP
jgi:uncharacterized protein (TIRG00374 family)